MKRITRTIRTRRLGGLGLGFFLGTMLLLPSQPGAITFTPRTSPGVHGTITFSGTIAASIDLSVTATTDASTTGAVGDGTANEAPAGTINFGNVDANCAAGASINGDCYLIGGQAAAHYVATMIASFTPSGYSAGTAPGLRICRDTTGWGASRLLVDVLNDDADWTQNTTGAGGYEVIVDVSAGPTCTGGNILVATAGSSTQTDRTFQIAGRVNAADTVSPSTAVTFESF